MSYDQDLVEDIEKSIKSWEVDFLKTEKQYENILYKHLHLEFPKLQVTKQYAQGRIRADLAVGEDIIIELKNNLKTTSQYQRLIGQLEQYREWDGYIFLILCGKTEINLLKEIKKSVDKNFSNDEISLFVKPDDSSLDEIFKSETNWLALIVVLALIYYIFLK